MAGKSRHLMASIVGWIIVAIVLYWLLGAVVATVGFVVRFFVWAIVIGALVTLYLNLRTPDG